VFNLSQNILCAVLSALLVFAWNPTDGFVDGGDFVVDQVIQDVTDRNEGD
jgi:hypothetical protein